MALRQGDEQAFREIYERFWLMLYRLAYKKLGSREEAEEIVQDIYTTLWVKRATAHIERLAPYLVTAVKYRVIDKIRAEQTQVRYHIATQDALSELDRSTEHHLAATDLSDALAVSVERLPAQTREVFRLSRGEHRTVAEIAERLHLSPKTVEYHLTKALKVLRMDLKDFLVLGILWLGDQH